jgi:putative flippase GtrA
VAAVAEGRGWLLALASIGVLSAAGAVAAIVTVMTVSTVLNAGFTYQGPDDPSYAEYARLQVLSALMSMIAMPLAVAAGLSIVALLVVLARRWDARFAYRAVESE